MVQILGKKFNPENGTTEVRVQADGPVGSCTSYISTHNLPGNCMDKKLQISWSEGVGGPTVSIWIAEEKPDTQTLTP